MKKYNQYTPKQEIIIVDIVLGILVAIGLFVNKIPLGESFLAGVVTSSIGFILVTIINSITGILDE